MMPSRKADYDTRAFALEVLRRTREAWLPQPATRRGLNPNATLEPKRLSGPSACRGMPRRAPWASIAVAVVVVVAVLAGELWAVHAVSAIDSTAAHRLVGDVSITLSRLAEASVVGPVD
jgi:hypothetical protein